MSSRCARCSPQVVIHTVGMASAAPQEVTALVGFVLSPDAAAITGQELVICGGASLT